VLGEGSAGGLYCGECREEAFDIAHLEECAALVVQSDEGEFAAASFVVKKDGNQSA
jgi:hypothetical protein